MYLVLRDVSEDDNKSALSHRDAGIEAKGKLSPHKLPTEEARKQHLLRKGMRIQFSEIRFILVCR